MYPCIESTIDFSPKSDITVRLWINESEIKDDYMLEHHISAITDYVLQKSPSNNELIPYVRSIIPNLNAIQVQRKVGNLNFGCVAYLVDFSEDVHG